MTDDAVRRTLARFARSSDGPESTGDVRTADAPRGTGRNPSPATTIARAEAAMTDLDDAAAFVETVGLAELERAVERAERADDPCADDGRRALAAYRNLRAAAAGEGFRSGRGTSLGGGDIGPSE